MTDGAWVCVRPSGTEPKVKFYLGVKGTSLADAYRHSQLITGSVLFGMAVLIGGQLLVERVFVYSVPVSVFITVGGGVYFLYLLLTQRKV